MNLSESSSKVNHRKCALATAIVCTTLLVLSGCKIPCHRSAEPGRDLPDTFRGVISEENSSLVSIEDFFNDPTLLNLIHQGMIDNQELRILAEDIQIANNEVLKRRGAYLPFVNLGGTAELQKHSLFTPAGVVDEQLQYRPGRTFPTPLPNFLTAANLSWQIDIWRQLRNARDAAALRFLGTAEGRNYVVTRLVAEIAENYYALMALDKRLENLNNIIELQEQSLEMATAKKEAAQGTELAVQRFQAEVRKNQSEKLIVQQEIIEVENRINFLVGRFPKPVERMHVDFLELNLPALSIGVPAQLLQNRPDIRQAERALEAAGLDVSVARANFYPKLIITAGVGYEAVNPKYLFMTPESLIYGVAGDLVAPLINKKAIQADYMTANAMQLQSVYNYQRVVLNAFTEVVNRMSKVENYGQSIEIKKQQLESLEASVDAATKLFQAARAEYMDVLFAQRDLLDARMVLIETKRQQLSAIVNTYQALGGGFAPFQYPESTYAPSESFLPVPIAPPEDGPDLTAPMPDNGDEEE